MDSLISSGLVGDIIDQLREIQSLPDNSPEQKEAIEALFDGEESLIHAVNDLITVSIQNLNTAVSDPQERSKIIRKQIITAMLTGFLAERYTRDVIMDGKAKIGKSIFKREYESIQQYLSRKAKQNKKSLQEIAKKEAEPDPEVPW